MIKTLTSSIFAIKKHIDRLLKIHPSSNNYLRIIWLVNISICQIYIGLQHLTKQNSLRMLHHLQQESNNNSKWSYLKSIPEERAQCPTVQCKGRIKANCIWHSDNQPYSEATPTNIDMRRKSQQNLKMMLI